MGRQSQSYKNRSSYCNYIIIQRSDREIAIEIKKIYKSKVGQARQRWCFSSP